MEVIMYLLIVVIVIAMLFGLFNEFTYSAKAHKLHDEEIRSCSKEPELDVAKALSMTDEEIHSCSKEVKTRWNQFLCRQFMKTQGEISDLERTYELCHVTEHAAVFKDPLQLNHFIKHNKYWLTDQCKLVRFLKATTQLVAVYKGQHGGVEFESIVTSHRRHEFNFTPEMYAFVGSLTHIGFGMHHTPLVKTRCLGSLPPEINEKIEKLTETLSQIDTVLKKFEETNT